MRKLNLNIRPKAGSPEDTNARAEQVAELLNLWGGLNSAGLTAEAQALQPLLAYNARFVVSLALQYQKQGVSQEVLVKAAHEALIKLLNQYAGHPEKLDKLLALTLRNSMATIVHTSTGR
jgi:DNA-directed RNA polymerase sigma subunit (sigma70/sigma32)